LNTLFSPDENPEFFNAGICFNKNELQIKANLEKKLKVKYTKITLIKAELA
jgi:hypothetical protein